MAATSTQSLRAQFPRNKAANYGVQIEPIPGISLSSTQMVVSLDSDKRYHGLIFQITANNYTGGTGKAITKLTGTGTGATGTLTISNGTPTAITIVSGGSSWNVGDTFTIADDTGAGFVGTAATVSSGALATATVTVAATPTAIDPRIILGNIYLQVGTTNVVETTCAMEIFRALVNYPNTANVPFLGNGQFPIWFTEPWRRTTDGRATSWDMAGQGVFTVKFLINQGYTNVNIVGVMVFDYIRNTVAGEIDQVTYQSYVASGNFPAPALKIIGRKLLTPQLNAGQTIIAPQLIPTGWPILRMHFFPGTPGTLSQILMKADTQIVFYGQTGSSGAGSVLDQLNEFFREWGFNETLTNSGQSIAPDFSFIADYDQRVQNALKVASAQITLQSSAAQGLTILQEYLETSYS